jgi:hypothetical protein
MQTAKRSANTAIFSGTVTLVPAIGLFVSPRKNQSCPDDPPAAALL